jgi:hypothetical protein
MQPNCSSVIPTIPQRKEVSMNFNEICSSVVMSLFDNSIAQVSLALDLPWREKKRVKYIRLAPNIEIIVGKRSTKKMAQGYSRMRCFSVRTLLLLLSISFTFVMIVSVQSRPNSISVPVPVVPKYPHGVDTFSYNVRQFDFFRYIRYKSMS